MEMTQDQVDALTPKLEKAIHKAVEEAGLTGYQLESIKLTPKTEIIQPPGSILKCTVEGFPHHPHIVCKIVWEQ